MREELTVTYYQVVSDRPLPGGGMLRCEPVSPKYADPDQADRDLERLRDDYPEAYLMRADWYSRDEAQRDELAAKIV